MSRGAITNAVEVTLRLQAGPGTVNGIAWELQANEESVRRVVYVLRDQGKVRPAGYERVGKHRALKAVRWEWAA